MRRFVVLLAALALVVSACGDDATVPPSSSAATTTVAAPPVGQAEPVEDDIDRLIAAAEQVRGLEFLDPPTITFLGDEVMADRIRSDLAEEIDPDEVELEASLFRLLGLMGPDLDLVAALTDLYAEQVAGFYDFDTKELVVAGSAEATPLTETVVVHELIHALTDQHFAFGARLDALIAEERYHEASAFQALLEGDATYFQIVYLQGLPSDQQAAVARESLLADTAVIEALPPFIGADLAFPYDAGFRFVSQIVADLGIAGVDQAYEAPPLTTEHILRAGSYFTLEPARPVELSVVLPGWEVGLAGTFGQWNIQNYLLGGVDGGQALIAADGWGGDAYAVLTDGDEISFVLRYLADTPRDAAELYAALVEGLPETADVGSPTTTEPSADDEPGTVASTATFTGGVFASVRRLGDELVLVVSTDADATTALATLLGPA